jgi:hypothetical protein
MMKKRKLGKNHGVWCGKVATEMEFSHEVKDRNNGEIIDKFFKLYIDVEIRNKNDVLIDLSRLPVTVSQNNLDALDKELEIGDIVFIKGSWRAYDYKNKDTNRNKLDQTSYVKILEVHDDYQVRTRNKFEFEAILVKKLYEFERLEDGTPVKDEKGRLIPKLDEEGKEIYTVRKNKEGKVVNDFIIAINRPNGSDYIPCISYGKLAKAIASDIEVGSEVEGSGYIRERRYTDRNGNDRVAYEAVVTSIQPLPVDENEVEIEVE